MSAYRHINVALQYSSKKPRYKGPGGGCAKGAIRRAVLAYPFVRINKGCRRLDHAGVSLI